MHFAGTVAVPGAELAFAVELLRGPAGYGGKIQIPAQGARDLPLAQVTVTTRSISFAIAQVGAKWEVTRDAAGEPRECRFEQGPAKLECSIARVDAARYGPSNTTRSRCPTTTPLAR